jgi:hypothetical protein
MKKLLVVVGLVALWALVVPGTASAGTQDFTLVNKTGVKINNLHVSEASKESWEEDVLGDKVLEDGDSVEISFTGHEACKWDLMVKDEEGAGVYWRGIDLCEVAKIVLHCGEGKCWATFE